MTSRASIEVNHATIRAAGGRPLFEGLSLSLTNERVALIGRNGVGKSTLLAVLAGELDVAQGNVVRRGTLHYVPQALPEASASDRGVRSLSHGEQRKLALSRAQTSGADVLLLDEPTDHLDDAGVAWLRGWLAGWPGGLVVVSHDRRLLQDFQHFFLASEAGCRYFSGTLSELDAVLEREHHELQLRYVSNLNRLAAREEHSGRVARRKARKKRAGRCAELDRATSRMRLNLKRSAAQVSHGRLGKLREARLNSLRQWSQSARRALTVDLALTLPVPTLPDEVRDDLLVLRDVSARVAERTLFQALDLRLGRQRVAVVGPNGAGKSTLFDIALGMRAPASGTARRELGKIGAIAQGGENWMLEVSLHDALSVERATADESDLARVLVAHKFPLALAQRPLCSLSPGERARAALICLFQRRPAIELLMLDEPTFSLDLTAQRAMTEALRAWPGGLDVASHDREFLTQLGVDTWLRLGT